MLNSLAIRLLWYSLSWLTRLAVVASATAAVLIAFAIIALRYYLLPNIERYHDRITASLASAIGYTVTIGKIEGDWQGLHPRLNFTDVRILDERLQPALVLPSIDSSVSWMSLFSTEFRLSSLEISRPELLIRRDVQGKVFIGGLAFNKQGDENDLSDWLLHQSRMVVRDAHLVWIDELRDAPPLVLQQVNLHIENFFTKHRFALRALPPAELATPLDLRGEFFGASFDEISKWHGQLFVQLDYTDVTAWRPWLELPNEFSRGRGALRGWLGITDGKVAQITSDFDLHDVVTKLADTVPQMEILDLHGRVAWKEVAGDFEISTKRLAMRLQDGIELSPTDFYFRTGVLGEGKLSGGVIRANQLQLEILASLAKYLPLQAGLRARLDAYAPSGSVFNLDANWQGVLEKPDSYKIKGRFDNLGLRQVGEMPGFSGLNVIVDGSEAAGRLSINTRQLNVDAPGMLREPLSFATMTGQVGWQRKHGELSINVDNIAVANEDMAGILYGSYHTLVGTRGVLDLTAKLTRGDIRRAARYTPLVALHQKGSDWLNGALLAGHTEDLRIRIKGNLSDFPLDGTKDVIFKIGGHARDAVLEFGKYWPRIENIAGEFLLNGNKLEVKSPSATMLGARLQNVSVTMPDVMSEELPLEIRGEAGAASKVFLQFIQQSPVRGYIDGFTDGMTASGNAHLTLFAHIPLLGDKPVQVSGNIQVRDNAIVLGKTVPSLRKTSGVLSFTESGMQSSGVTAEILGGPASINIQTAEGGVVHVTAQGRCDVDAYRKIESHPLLNYLQGATEWDVDISVVKKSAHVIVKSNLQGIRSSLPQPLAKSADEVMPVRIEKSAGTDGRDIIAARVNKLLSARLVRREEKGEMVVEQGVINFGTRDLSDQDFSGLGLSNPSKSKSSRGKRKAARGEDGVWLQGSLPMLSIQGWEGLAGSMGRSVSAFSIEGVNLSIDKLDGYGLDIENLRIDAAKRGEALAVQLASRKLNGEAVWQPHGYVHGHEMSGKLKVRLSNLQWGEDEQHSTSAQPDNFTLPEKIEPLNKDEPKERLQMEELPALDIAIENFQIGGKQIGRFELVGHPEGEDWRMRRLHITNQDGALTGDGIWYGGLPSIKDGDIAVGTQAGSAFTDGEATARGVEAGSPNIAKAEPKIAPTRTDRNILQSQINLLLEISDAGKILARSGYPNTVNGGSGKLAANLSWSGTPNQFNYASLNGTLKVDTDKGRFVKMEPGVGKLLSILSMQALPKRITMDFNDVFSEGFQFDNINGNASIKNGVLDTQDFRIDGSSARVTMKGSVDLNTETQNLRVRVLPTLGDSVSLIGAFAAGPAVGIGSLILNKVLGDPLDKLVSFEYNVTGSWSDPNVVKVGGVQPKQNNTSE
ncbi:MAG: YhdP family protein [Gallionella sp.]